MSEKITKSRRWLLAGYLAGIGLSIYPALKFYQYTKSPHTNSPVIPQSTTDIQNRLNELDQLMQSVNLRIHRLGAELVSGKMLYRQSMPDNHTQTYFGHSFRNKEELYLLLKEKWTQLEINTRNRNNLWAQRLELNGRLQDSDHEAFIENIVPDLQDYLESSDPELYIYWPTRDAYFVMLTRSAQKPADTDVVRFLQQTPLQKYIISIPVNSQHRVIERIRLHAQLSEQIQNITRQYFIQDHWQLENGHTAWLLRINLEGKAGLSATLLPGELKEIRNRTPLTLFEPDKNQTIKSEYSAVVFDLRRFPVRPGLFPQLVTTSGINVFSVDQVEPNKLINNGVMAYSNSILDLKMTLGKDILIIPVVQTRGRFDLEWLVSEADALKMLEANRHNSLFYRAKLGVLLAR